MPSINDYYEQILQNARRKILSKGDQYILQVELTKLIDYYYDKYSLPLIEKDNTREIDYEQQSYIRRTPSGIPIGRSLRLTIRYPIIPHDRMIEVLRRKSSTFFLNRYSLQYDNGYIISKIDVRIAGGGQEKRFEAEIKTIEQIIEQKNNNVRSRNQSYKRELKQFVEQHQNRVEKDTELVESVIKKIIATPVFYSLF